MPHFNYCWRIDFVFKFFRVLGKKKLLINEVFHKFFCLFNLNKKFLAKTLQVGSWMVVNM